MPESPPGDDWPFLPSLYEPVPVVAGATGLIMALDDRRRRGYWDGPTPMTFFRICMSGDSAQADVAEKRIIRTTPIRSPKIHS